MCAGTAAADPMGTALSSCGPGRIRVCFYFPKDANDGGDSRESDSADSYQIPES